MVRWLYRSLAFAKEQQAEGNFNLTLRNKKMKVNILVQI
jgi:hypothetical protein